MLLTAVFVVVISFCFEPCFAPNPVSVHNGITEQIAKTVHGIMGITTEVQNTADHWRTTFHDEGDRMLPYALTVFSNTMRANKIDKREDLWIGAIVSISGNGGGILHLIGSLRRLGYTKLIIVVICNPKENNDQTSRGDYIAFDEMIRRENFTNVELFFLRNSRNRDYKYHSYRKLTVAAAINKLKDVQVLFDGICGGGHGASTIDKPYTTSSVLKYALKILPELCPANTPTKIKIISNGTPSGRTETGTWLDSAEFVCYAIVSISFPFDALKVDKIVPGQIVSPPQNILLAELPLSTTGKQGTSFLNALKSIAPKNLLKTITAVEEALKTSKWVNIVAM